MTKNVYYYPAILQKEDVGYSAWLYDIEGCISQGDTFEETIENLKEALGLFFEDYKENEAQIPTASDPEKIKLETNQMLVVMEFNWIEYIKKNGKRAIKKTLTIPAWLNTMAEEKHINFSRILQSALKEQLNVK